MNKITYISNINSNSISSLDMSLLSNYILNSEEQQYFDNIYSETTSFISSLTLKAAVKAGSTLYTKPSLNNLYVQQINAEGYTKTDLNDLRDFMNSQMVGNNVIDFEELSKINV